LGVFLATLTDFREARAFKLTRTAQFDRLKLTELKTQSSHNQGHIDGKTT
jgi:hypothetical protein